MTTEDDFQSALDATPGDWHTRLVFADWLQDRGDPRAEGYRALGVMRKRSYVCGFDNGATGEWIGAGWVALEGEGDEKVFCLPADWFKAIKGLGADKRYRPYYGTPKRNRVRRSEVEDAVAVAFSRLPAERRAELLASPPHESDSEAAGAKKAARGKRRK